MAETRAKLDAEEENKKKDREAREFVEERNGKKSQNNKAPDEA